jgi:translocator protein
MSSKYKSLIAFLVLTVGGGLAIGVFNIPGAWYAALAKPSFNPPNWIFGPVWTTLYFMIAYAGWLLWLQNRNSLSMKLWFLALGLNFLWSPTFFGAENTGLALIVILALLATLVFYLAATWRVNNRAALLFLPYMAWVSFASLLNAAIFQLN